MDLEGSPNGGPKRGRRFVAHRRHPPQLHGKQQHEMMPSQKPGTARPMVTKPVAAQSPHVFWCVAASKAAGMATSSASKKAATASSSVAGNFWLMNSPTGFLRDVRHPEVAMNGICQPEHVALGYRTIQPHLVPQLADEFRAAPDQVP